MSLLAAVAALVVAPLSGCETTDQARDTPGSTRLTVWGHGGVPEEHAALTARIESFEAAHPGTTVDVKIHEVQDDYNDAIQTAIAAGQLPDVLDIDGPNIASYAYQGALTPLDDLLDPRVVDRMLPSLVAQGTWNDQLWAVGAFDSGLAIYGDRTALARAGVRIPEGPDDAWTGFEMTDALAALAADDPDGKVIDLPLRGLPNEFTTYAVAPLLYSAGAALLDPESGRATGTLDSPAAVGALTDLARWAAYVDPDEDGNAFADRRVALSWIGHWAYPTYAAALGDDLVLIPLPDLGRGTKSGQGSWAWAVGSTTAEPSAAAALVDWLTDDAAATAMADANGGVPGTSAALEASPLYGPGMPLRMFADNLARTCGTGPITRDCIGVPRAITPGYQTVTAAFATAVLAVMDGADPQRALSEAAGTIDTVVDLNDGYASPSP